MKDSAINIVGYLPSKNGKLHQNCQIYYPYGGGHHWNFVCGNEQEITKGYSSCLRYQGKL